MPATLRRSARWRHQQVPTVPAVGTVVALINTEKGCSDRPFVHFVLRVELDGYAPYDATASANVPVDLLRLLRPGARLSLQVDPTEPTTPIIDLSRCWITPAQLAS
jgi:hypothetical protein